MARPGTFKPGQSGNPGGRAPIIRDIQELARKHTPEAIDALVKSLADPKTRVTAAVALLDRGYGKPGQTIDLNHHLPAAAADDAALLAIALSGRRDDAAPEGDTLPSGGLVH